MLVFQWPSQILDPWTRMLQLRLDCFSSMSPTPSLYGTLLTDEPIMAGLFHLPFFYRYLYP